jgi:hypothetical protein
VPDDLRDLVGKREERFGLGTRDPSEAKRLHALKLAEVEERWANLRVRSLGVVDKRISPNHSWRHRIKTLGRRNALAVDILDAMTGQLHLPARRFCNPRRVGKVYRSSFGRMSAIREMRRL